MSSDVNEVMDNVAQGLNPQVNQIPMAFTDLESQKMNMLRGFVSSPICYDLEAANKTSRIEAIVSFLNDIKDTIDPNFPVPELQNQSILYLIFKGNVAGDLANANPRDELETKEKVTDYYLKFIPDIIYKSVHGVYPDRRARGVHGIGEDAKITPLTVDELTGIYSRLNKDINEPLFNLGDLRNLRDIARQQQPINLQQFIAQARIAGIRIFGGLPQTITRDIRATRELNRNLVSGDADHLVRNAIHLVRNGTFINHPENPLDGYIAASEAIGASVPIANLAYTHFYTDTGSSDYEQANSYAGSLVIGITGGTLAFLGLSVMRRIAVNTSELIRENFFNREVPAGNLPETREVRLSQLRSEGLAGDIESNGNRADGDIMPAIRGINSRGSSYSAVSTDETANRETGGMR